MLLKVWVLNNMFFLFANIKLIPLEGDRFCCLALLTTLEANIGLNKLKQFELCRLFLL